MPWDTGNINILHARSVQKTRMETTQQIAVPHGIPWISGKRQPPRDICICIGIGICICICVCICVCVCICICMCVCICICMCVCIYIYYIILQYIISYRFLPPEIIFPIDNFISPFPPRQALLAFPEPWNVPFFVDSGKIKEPCKKMGKFTGMCETCGLFMFC